jgi:membrane protease YdiL (CAAX protease family)
MTLEGVLPRRFIEAGGSLPREGAIVRPGLLRRWRLAVELGVLFIGSPLLITFALHALHIPLFLLLPPVLAGLVIYLLWDPTFHVRGELYRGFAISELWSILAMFVIVGGSVAAFVAQQMPTMFLNLPHVAPRLWVFILIAYPIASVMAQELVYRTFFFHRYGPLFGDRRWLAITSNGLLFGFAHIIFGSFVSVALTTAVGFLLAYRYERTRSFWAVWLEHSLYGGLVFTVGLGRYFFTGVASLG